MFSITVQFIHGIYEATSNDAPGKPEWPPHPARLFSGLVAVADGADDDAALDWLERLPPPLIDASAAVSASRRSTFVITNDFVKASQIAKTGGRHMEFSGRIASGQRTWARVAPRHPQVVFSWEGEPSEHLVALDRMARSLPYLGRSTTPVVASLVDEQPGDSVDLGADTWVPADDGEAEVTVPHPGFRAALSAAYDAEEHPWTVRRSWCRYRPPGSGPADPVPESWPSAFDEPIVFGIEGRSKPAYQSVVRYTTAFRNAVISALDAPGQRAIPVALHGHSAKGESTPRHRVMVVGLPFVGMTHADGHLLGFGVCVPRDLSVEDRAAIYRGLVEVDELFGPGIGRVRLTRQRRNAQTLNPRRWTDASDTWLSAYPIVLDRHISSDAEVEPLIRSACRHLDLPDPICVEWSKAGMIDGTDHLAPHQLVRRRGERARPAVHAQISFAQPVAGPMVLGNMRHLGLGLMLPGREGAS